METKLQGDPVSDSMEQAMYNCCRRILACCHSHDEIDEPFVYLLCNDGSLQISQGKKNFLKGHICEQASSLNWSLRDLPVSIPEGYGPTSAIAVDKWTAVRLRNILDPALSSVASSTDEGEKRDRPQQGESNPHASIPQEREEKPANIALNPFKNLSKSDQEKFATIYASAYKAAIAWKFDPDDVANYVLIQLSTKLDRIRAPATFAWRVATRYCAYLYRQANSRPLHVSYEESARTYGPSFSCFLRSILSLSDTLDSWLLCSKLFTELTMIEIACLTNHFSHQVYSEPYYRLRMHAAIKSIDF